MLQAIRFEFFCKYHHNGQRHLECCAYVICFPDSGCPTFEVHRRGNLTQGNRIFQVSDRQEFVDALKGWLDKIGKQHERFLGSWQGNYVLAWDDGDRTAFPLTPAT